MANDAEKGRHKGPGGGDGGCRKSTLNPRTARPEVNCKGRRGQQCGLGETETEADRENTIRKGLESRRNT